MNAQPSETERQCTAVKSLCITYPTGHTLGGRTAACKGRCMPSCYKCTCTDERRSALWMNGSLEPAKPLKHLHDHCTLHAALVHLPSTQVVQEPCMHGDDDLPGARRTNRIGISCMGGTHHECGPSCSFVREKLMFTPGRTLTDWDGTRAAVVTKISSLIALICLLALEKARVCSLMARTDAAGAPRWVASCASRRTESRRRAVLFIREAPADMFATTKSKT